MSPLAQRRNGDRQNTPTGGSQVYGDGRWHDVHSEAGRRYLAAPAHNDNGPAIPANVEAEQALLGALLYEPEAAFAVSELEPSHFYEPFHQRLFGAIRENAIKGRATDPSLFASRFASDPAWEELGGTDYLVLLIDRAPPSANAPDYAREILSNFTRRELIRLGGEITQLGAEGVSKDTDELVAEAEHLLAGAAAVTGGKDEFAPAGEVVRDAITHARTRAGRVDYPSGLRGLDEVTGGLNAGEVTILAARPGVGKTVGAMTVARANAAAGLGTCVFSLEMSKNKLGLRLATDVAFDRRAPVYSRETTNPTAHRADNNQLDAGQWQQLEEAQAVIAEWPLLIDDRPGLTLAKIEAAARRAHRKWAKQGIRPGPVIIDHMGKVRPSTDRKGNKHAETADISNGVAEMAKRLKVPVLALVQLNRGIENREDKKPQLSDLRGAGEWEEDARVVLMLSRPEMYLREPATAETPEAELNRREKLRQVENHLFWQVEKNSHGPCTVVRSFCEIACSAIREWEV